MPIGELIFQTPLDNYAPEEYIELLGLNDLITDSDYQEPPSNTIGYLASAKSLRDAHREKYFKYKAKYLALQKNVKINNY